MALVPWNAAQTVNTTTGGEQSYSHIATLADGSLVVTWVDFSSGNADVRFQRFDAMGKKLGGETLAHAASASIQAYCDIAALTDGGFVITYVDVQGNTLFGQKFNSAGGINGGPIVLSNPALTNLQTYNPPTVQALAAGTFAVIYSTWNFVSSGTGEDLVGRIVSAAGVPGAAFGIPAHTPSTGQQQTTPATALTQTGEMMVTWASNDNIYGHDIYVSRYSANGTALLIAPIPVNTDVANMQFAPSITSLSNGLFVVTWYTDATTGNTGTDIHGQIIDVFGTKIGSEFLAGTTRIGIQLFSKVVPLADGMFMVIYATDNGGNEALRAQMFSSMGTAVGAELLLSGTGMDNTTVADAVTLPDGRVAVTWADNTADGNGTGIRLQILDPREGIFMGTPNADKIYGNDGGNDFFYGGAGADTVYGLRGNDTLLGEAGDDEVYGGKGDDTAYGGDGADFLIGSNGDDDLFGEAGDDNLRGNSGADLLDGGDGSDFASYATEASGADVFLDGSAANAGSAAGDTYVSIENVSGSAFADEIRGSAAVNRLYGNDGADTLIGLDGADTLRGGLGVDTLSGGADADTFQYLSASEGGDIITSFSSLDFFAFNGSAFGGLAAGALAATRFVSRASDNLAQNTTQRFIYQENTDQLWFDSNGSTGGATNAVLIADITGNAVVTAGDILIF